MASNLFFSSSSKSSKLATSNEKANNMVDLIVKCGTEFKNQSVAALGSLCNKCESNRASAVSTNIITNSNTTNSNSSSSSNFNSNIPPLLMPAAATEMSTIEQTSSSPCLLKSAVSSLCRSMPCPSLPSANTSSSSSSLTPSSPSTSFQFIDPSELMRNLCEITKRPFLILLDCRPRTEFNNQHIKDSVHLNCRDKLIKKRLQMQKITIRDLISCELTKSKLDNAAAVLASSTTTSTKSSDNDDDDDYRRIKNESGGETTASTQTPSSCRVLSSASLASKFEFSPSPKQIMTATTTTTTTTCSGQSPLNQSQSQQQQQQQDQENDQQESNENIIVIYDDTTCDDKDLLVESNPLKIVQENIRKAGIRKECKILKGGFKQFAAMCPDLCRSELKKSNVCNASSFYYEQLQDQHQSMIDNTQMTEITPYLYLGNEMDAKNVTKLAQMGIFHILNVTKNIPFYDLPSSSSSSSSDSSASPSPSSSPTSSLCSTSSSSSSEAESNSTTTITTTTTPTSKFVFKRISVNDSFNQSLKEYFDETFEFIDEARRNNSKVLVHCQAGVSRSPTIVIAYLMRLLGISMSDAYNRVRELRPIVAPNIVFWSQLTDYEAKLKSQQQQQQQQYSHRAYFANCSGSANSHHHHHHHRHQSHHVVNPVRNPNETNSSSTEAAAAAAIECN